MNKKICYAFILISFISIVTMLFIGNSASHYYKAYDGSTSLQTQQQDQAINETENPKENIDPSAAEIHINDSDDVDVLNITQNKNDDINDDNTDDSDNTENYERAIEDNSKESAGTTNNAIDEEVTVDDPFLEGPEDVESADNKDIIANPLEELQNPDVVLDLSDIKHIALTFDDGPRVETTGRLLDILKDNNAKATFFVMGQRVENNPDLVKRMYDEGHAVGNHTFNHKDLTKLKESDVNSQIEKTNVTIRNIIDADTSLLRPTYGAYNSKTMSMAKDKSMFLILWDIDPMDWNSKNADRIHDHIVSRAKDGDIILLHDIYHTSVDAAEKVVKTLSEKGFVFVTVPELIELYQPMEYGCAYRSGKGAAVK